MHLPECIGRASQHSIRIFTLKKMKRGLRSRLEATKTETQRLNSDLNDHYATDREELQRCRTRAYNIAYNHESEHYRRKLSRLERNRSRASTETSPIAAATDRLTIKTEGLSEAEKRVLSRGPKFALAAGVTEDTEEICRTAFARFAYQYRWGVTRDARNSSPENNSNLPSYPRSSEINMPPPMDRDTEDRLRRVFSSLMTTVRSLPKRRKWSNLPQIEATAIRGLRSKPVALMPSDKGGEFCAIDADTYKSLGRSHLADATTYRPIPRMTAKTVEAKINRTWKTICRERGVPTRCERSFTSSSTRLATFHHVIKTHKAGTQLKIRPIVASRDSPTERITWLLNHILSPLLKDVPTHMPDSNHLMTALVNTAPQVLSEHQHQCSLDVEALYTSVPVNEAVAAVQHKLELQRGGGSPDPLQTEDVVRLLREVLRLAYFHFDGQVYLQTSGLPMGCAVSGIVAILFLETIERRALSQFARCPLFFRYVDDCYAVVKDAAAANELQAIFNTQHPAIRYELENCQRDRNDSSLDLLDLTVRINSSGQVFFDFYTKPAKSSVFMHRDSALPWSQKTAAINNEKRRIGARSERQNEAANAAAFNEKLRANGYTDHDLQQLNSTTRRRRRGRTLRGQPHYIDLPYLGEGAEHKIRRAFQREDINIRIYRRSITILDVVRPRQPEVRRCAWSPCPTKATAECFIKNCVYEVTCLPCGQHYVGSTTRPLHERIREHTIKGRGSTIHGHLLACGGGTAQVQIKILAKEKDAVNTRLREALLIKKRRPELNIQEDSDLVF
jgi:hypothetical protein